MRQKKNYSYYTLTWQPQDLPLLLLPKARLLWIKPFTKKRETMPCPENTSLCIHNTCHKQYKPARVVQHFKLTIFEYSNSSNTIQKTQTWSLPTETCDFKYETGAFSSQNNPEAWHTTQGNRLQIKKQALPPSNPKAMLTMRLVCVSSIVSWLVFKNWTFIWTHRGE